MIRNNAVPLMLIASIGCAILCSEAVSAQTVGDPAKVRMQEQDARELQLSGPRQTDMHAADPKRSQAMMDQVGEDFQRILTLHNEIVRGVTARTPLSDQFISGATGEIRKRASRLQSSLKLTKPEPGSDQGLNLSTMQINEELIVLCEQIESFVRNPIIEKPGTVDAAALSQARHDLEGVVEISGAIKKQVDKRKP